MAGIEKVCEYSGEYGYGDMYNWKRSHIQIMPKYRKLFKSCSAVLYICKNPEKQYLFKSGGYTDYHGDEHIWGGKGRVVKQYTYMLKVYNNELQGNVEGNYLNWSFDIKTVIRKMKRLTGNSKLKIEFIDEVKFDGLY